MSASEQRWRTTREGSDRGQAVLLVLAVVVLVVVVMMGLARFGARVLAEQQAQVAADAAALAGVDGGEAAARRFAERNGGALVSFRRDIDSVTVVVAVGEARASARAGRRPEGGAPDADLPPPDSP